MGWILYVVGALSLIFVGTSKAIDKKNEFQIELQHYNMLLKCDNCGKFHRKYQEELEMRINRNYKNYHTCPRCYHHSPIYSGEHYPWLDTHPEFPKLTWKDLQLLKKTLRNIEKLSYEDRVIEKFLYYHHLLPNLEELSTNKEKHPREG